MPAPEGRPIELEPGTPIANAVTRGRQAFAQGDVMAADAAYREAVGLAVEDSELRLALAIDHAEQLRASGQATLALKRCAEYMVEAGAKDLPLRLLQAEIRSSLGDHSGAGADAAAIRTALGIQPDALAPDDIARLHRVEGLVATDCGDLDQAIRNLDAAQRIFGKIDNWAGVTAIDRDRVRASIWQGEGNTFPVGDVFSGGPPQTVSDYLLHAVALKRELRYEEALQVLLHGAFDRDFDPALHWHLLYEIIVLFRLIRQDSAAEQLRPWLRDAAAVSADPAAAAAAIDRLFSGGVPSDVTSPQFDRVVQHARRLIIGSRLDEAWSVLVERHSQARTDRDICTWHLAAGELELARYELSRTRSLARNAVDHLGKAADHASTTALVEVRACALRLLGRAYARLDDHGRAAARWAEAHRLEEHIAARQITDNVRTGMLQAVPDEYDERIRAAAETLGDRGAEATAAIVVAMEAARGAMILARILPGEMGFARDLPGPSDLDGAWRWVNNIVDSLPKSQMIWIMHPTPDRIYHAVMGCRQLYHTSVSVWRKKLVDTIDAHRACWDGKLLGLGVTDSQFSETLEEIAVLVGVNKVIPALPPRTHRIAIVAGGELSDIPFAALAVPGETEPIGLRFALSDLPCLSARLPLHRRSRRLRGDRLLLVSPPDGLTRASDGWAHTVLDDTRATVATLEAELGLRRYHQVRIDSHGQHDHRDPTKSWLQLAPAGPGGRLEPEKLQEMDLRSCGTVVLGACESGMAQRVGRDERIGFVRAAVHAGAPAVVAARWAAEDTVAAAVLDRFTRYVRYLPRDLALQHAQLDVCRGAPGIPADVPAVGHPARWACWTLYGDAGWQTGAGPVRRALRHGLDGWRRRVPRA